LGAIEEQLDKTKAKGALETELRDTKPRIDKLQEDLDELRSVSPDGWWDVGSERVGEYIERVEASIKRLDDNKTQTDKPRRWPATSISAPKARVEHRLSRSRARYRFCG
jgi:hypothetical protein